MKKGFAVAILLLAILMVPPVISGLDIEDYAPIIEAGPEKKRAGDSIDFGDGYILLIKNVNPGDGKVSIELQLDDRTIDDKILRKGEFYESEKYNGVPILIEVVDIYHEAMGEYVILEIIELFPMLSPHVNLIISSVPERADIYLDGEYVGKTTRKISVIPDFKMRSLRLVLRGYEEEEQTFKFGQGETTKKIQMTLSKIEPTPTPTPMSTPTPMLPLHVDLNIASVPQGADIYLDGEYVGKTTRKISVIPDFKMHSLRLVLRGYEEEEQTFKFEQGETTKKIQMTLSKIEPTPTPTSTSTPTPMLPLHVDLNIASVPQGADIYLDGEYVGKTTRKISVIPDFKMHSLCLVLRGYKEEEQTFKFEQGEKKKEIQMTLSKIEPTPTSRPTLTPSTPTPTPPAPTPVSHAYSPTPTPPGFLAITVILAILCGFLILKRKHS